MKVSDLNIDDKIYVEWVDSSLIGGWVDTGDERNYDLGCQSVGLFVASDKVSISFAGSKGFNRENYYNSVMTIPRVAIREIRLLK
jgi:hypothetical protein|tara:strand:- start:8916 stop:9170 length:255 start_codon:yes stop_codon:yes gene_type:complete